LGRKVILLRNGQVLEGDASREGERYTVVVGDGEISVRARDVETVCGDLHEAYRWKQAQVHLNSARDHVQLALWCQRQGLPDLARKELEAARAVDPNDPTIPLVLRRIEVGTTPLVSGEPVPEIEIPPDRDDLDQLVRGLPAGTVETFTHVVQPLLMKRCATAGCHGPQTPSEYQFMRIPANRPPSRRVTQLNLQATLRWVDRDNPLASPLLTAPIRAHGGADKAVFQAEELPQYRRIADWVHQIAHAQKSAKPPSPQPPAPSLGEVQSAGFLQSEGRLPQPQQLPGQHVTDGIPPSPKRAIGMMPPLPLDHTEIFGNLARIKRGAQPAGFQPVDPFDPEIYNQRFFPADRGPSETISGGLRRPSAADGRRPAR
jgi:hypothetical protein